MPPVMPATLSRRAFQASLLGYATALRSAQKNCRTVPALCPPLPAGTPQAFKVEPGIANIQRKPLSLVVSDANEIARLRLAYQKLRDLSVSDPTDPRGWAQQANVHCLRCAGNPSGGLDKIDEVLRAWELWGADLLESHLSYPMLAYYRSQHHDQSWLGALAAIMDTCALILVGVEDIKPLQARMTFAMARQVVLEMARSLEVSAAVSVAMERLPAEDFEKMLGIFKEAGLTWKGGEGARETLAAVRATYEPVMHGLADHLLIPLPLWVAADDATDHWERGARGIIASRLISGLADGSISEGSAKGGPRGGGWVSRVRKRPGSS